MALVSPGVEVTIIDQSQYLPAASSSVPLILLATAQNKINASGTAVAAATTKANANKLYTITSQRDLVNLYGNPFFYKTTNGTSIQGYELNEYGLQAAYSLMAVTNRCYILRADVDLAELVGTLSRPTGEPADGTYWLDTTNSTWGIYEFNATTGKFTNKLPLVLTDSSQITGGAPLSTLVNIGDYAVIPQVMGNFLLGDYTYFYKDKTGTWVGLGTSEWKGGLSTVKGTATNVTTLTAGDQFQVELKSTAVITLTVPDSGGGVSTLDEFVAYINGLGITNLVAENLGTYGPISFGTNENGLDKYVKIYSSGTNSAALLTTLGLTAGTFYSPDTVFGTSAQMPLWTSSQSKPHPTGSVWIKTSVAGSGVDLAVSEYNSSTATWQAKNVSTYSTTLAAIDDLDSSGGQNIPQGTVFAQYGDSVSLVTFTPTVFWERIATGPTVGTGSISGTMTVPSGGSMTVQVSDPGSNSTTTYSFTTSGGDASSFVTDWINANINYTSIIITTDGAIQISHTEGGEIWMHDYDMGQSSGVISSIGFEAGNATNVVGTEPYVYSGVNVTQDDTSGSGSGFTMTLDVVAGYYSLNSLPSGGVVGSSNYNVGDTITIYGSQIGGADGTNDLVLTVTSVDVGTDRVTGVAYLSGTARQNYLTQISGWQELNFIANEGAPVTLPNNGRYWYYSTATQVDVMVQKGGSWIGYKNTAYDSSGNPSSTGVNATDPLGPIMSTDAPTTQTDGSSLVYGDLWVDTNDLENYPIVYRWQQVDGVDQWVTIDTTDQVTSAGVLFADARWGSNGAINPVDDPIPTIVSLLSSNYVDLDCPDPALYPQGMLLWNTRRSGYNVKKFTTNYFNNANFPNAGAYDSGDTTNINNLPEFSYTWVSASGLKTNGQAYMGRKAQRNLVVQAMRSSVDTNQSIREEDTFFNLISAPNYPELQPNMVALNNERNNTAYIIGDTPLRLPDQGTDITNWATNKSGASATGEDGLVTRDTYLGIFYPSGITTDLTGSQIVVPASHMMLRTFLRNDTIAYPWFAAAGTRRGTIDNATNIGYLDSATGEFVTIKNRVGIRDVLYTNQINPLAYFTGVGLLNYGNKNTFDTTSALDRTNVARLVAYIRDRLQVAARPFVFEPNDALTRSQLSSVVQSLFIDLVAKRGIYDYLVVCDETNNTPARIDRNELWVDVAIEPVKAAEFIYIPVRVMNTGEIAATGGA